MATIIDGSTGIVTSALDLTTALPATEGGTGVVSAGTAGNVLVSDGTNWSSSTLPLHYGTSVSSASGTSVVLSGIPSWAKRVTILWNGVTCSANTTMTLNSVATGYTNTQGRLNATGTVTNSNASGTSFTMTQNAPSGSFAKYVISLANPSTYFYVAEGYQQAGTNMNFLMGGVAVGAALSSITFAGGTFSAGEMSVIYE